MATQTVQQGWSQQSPAVQQIIRSGIGVARSTVRKTRARTRTARSSSATSKKRKKRAATSKRSSSTSRILKKGSAAAKAWGKKMAKLRRK